MQSNGHDTETPSEYLGIPVKSIVAVKNLNCDSTGENAQHAVHKCQAAADYIREMGESFLALAQTVKATGDALAADIEARARHFDAVMKSARDYAQQTHDVFAQERGRLSELKLPGHGK